MRQTLYICPPASPLVSSHAASFRCIYRIMPTPTDQLFVLTQVAPLYCLSLLIRVIVRVDVGPMYMYPLRRCCCASHLCTVPNCDCTSTLQLLSPPPSCFVFGDGFCYMRTFWTRGYREAGPVEKKPGWKTLVPRTINAKLVRKVEGAGLLLVLVRMYPLRIGELKN